MSVTKKGAAKKAAKKSTAKKAVKKSAVKKSATPTTKATTSKTYRPRLSEDAVIRVVTNEPPYRPNSDAAIHFAAMKGGITVGAYLKKFDKSTEDHRKARQWLWNIVRDENVKVLGA